MVFQKLKRCTTNNNRQDFIECITIAAVHCRISVAAEIKTYGIYANHRPPSAFFWFTFYLQCLQLSLCRCLLHPVLLPIMGSSCADRYTVICCWWILGAADIWSSRRAVEMLAAPLVTLQKLIITLLYIKYINIQHTT